MGWLGRVGADTFDDQLAPRHAQRDRPAVQKEALGAPDDPVDGWLERGMAGRVHRVLVESNRQVDQELAQVARQRQAVGPARPAFGREGAEVDSH